MRLLCLFLHILCSVGLLISNSYADPLVEQETRAAQARISHGVTGRGVAVAILDRGIDWTHPDFRLADGSTRIAYLLDLTDPSGAGRPDNPLGAGTIYTRADINAALSGIAPPLPTRDAVGHGTATAGNCCGNGRASDGRYTGIAPDATLLIVKLVSDGAPAHGNQAAEAYFYRPELFDPAVDYVIAKAKEMGLPLVMLANFGSQYDRADGSDAFAKKIDSVVGPGKPGTVFVTGTGDDGGRNNHASGRVGAGQTVSLRFVKGRSDKAWVQIWYPESDRFSVSWQGPDDSQGPFTGPANNTNETRSFSGVNYAHHGAVYFGNRWRRIQLELTGPVGTYTLQLTGNTVVSGDFEALIWPAHYWYADANRFLDLATSAKTIWAGATAKYNIAPNSYVFRHSWQDINNITRTVNNEGALGELWAGSSVGPTWDGRIGVDISAPGERTITSYASNSYWATFRHNLVSDGAGLYGIASAVSAAAPITAGAIALMLEKNPAMDAATVKAALQRGARVDAFTGEVPNTRYGHGKLDLQGALGAVPISESPTTPQTAPQAGIWWNPAESGRGYTLEVQGNQLILTLYMYETSGSAVWYTGSLTQQPDGKFTGSLQRFAGGQTLIGAYKPPSDITSPATASLAFSSATHATLTLTPAGVAAHSIAIQKFTFGSGNAAPAFQNGIWWNASQSGRGFYVESQGNQVSIGAYMYDETGQPVWYTTLAPLSSDGLSASGQLLQFANGQTLGGSPKAPALISTLGTVIFTATSNNTAQLTMPNGSQINLTRFLFAGFTPTGRDLFSLASLD